MLKRISIEDAVGKMIRAIHVSFDSDSFVLVFEDSFVNIEIVRGDELCEMPIQIETLFRTDMEKLTILGVFSKEEMKNENQRRATIGEQSEKIRGERIFRIAVNEIGIENASNILSKMGGK